MGRIAPPDGPNRLGAPTAALTQGRSAAERDEAQDVVGEGEERGAPQDLVQSTHGQAVKSAMLLGVRIDRLGCGGALLVDRLGVVDAHPLAPAGHRLAVLRTRRMRIPRVAL